MNINPAVEKVGNHIKNNRSFGNCSSCSVELWSWKQEDCSEETLVHDFTGVCQSIKPALLIPSVDIEVYAIST
jgi:hypothetical protein